MFSFLKKKLRLGLTELQYLVANLLPIPISNQLFITGPTKKGNWSIGIAFGNSIDTLSNVQEVTNPVITRKDVTDVRARFVADPFMVKFEDQWVMFFEVLNQTTRLGEIGFATSKNMKNWKYNSIVISEIFHLSYPYVFEWLGDHYLIPESCEANAIRLYKASNFPEKWHFVGNIMAGGTFIDPSIFHYDDKWWLFTETNPSHNFDTLRLYHSDSLLGPWCEHPKSPIINGNSCIARPAGRVLVENSRIIRFTQNCAESYGSEVKAFEITKLTLWDYQETELPQSPVFVPSREGWNTTGVHHFDIHILNSGLWFACMDGRG